VGAHSLQPLVPVDVHRHRRGTARNPEWTDAVVPGGVFGEALGLATLRRKATFSWGWDFGPRVPSIGIWRPVELVHERGAVLTGHHIRTDRINEDGSADVTVEASGDARATP
jgi:hypothetical protein